MRIQTPKLDFVGIGSSRCGTTWIAKCLADHPDIFVPSKKELHYYNNRQHMSRKPLEFYFSDVENENVYGEYTPRYIINRTALDHIKDAHPDATIIISLRDPIERAISQYKQKRYNLGVEEIDSFETALTGPYREDYITKGLYAHYMSTVFDIFDRNQIHLIFMKDIKNKPESVITDLYSSVGVDKSFNPPALKKRINESGPETGNILKTDLESDEVMIRGKQIEMFDRVRSAGEFTLEKFRIKSLVQPTASNIFHKIRHGIESRPRNDDPVESNRKNNNFSINRDTKVHIYNEYFADEVEEFEEMIDRDLSHWGP